MRQTDGHRSDGVPLEIAGSAPRLGPAATRVVAVGERAPVVDVGGRHTVGSRAGRAP